MAAIRPLQVLSGHNRVKPNATSTSFNPIPAPTITGCFQQVMVGARKPQEPPHMFSYAQPTSKAQAAEIAQSFFVHLRGKHGLPGAAPRRRPVLPRSVYVPPLTSWTVRAMMRARKWHLPTINEPAIVLATLMFAGTGALLHAAAFI